MSPIRMSKLESAIRTVLQLYEAFNRRDVLSMIQLMHDDCILETTGPAPDGGIYSGKEDITRYWQDFFHGSPRAHIEIEEVFGMGYRCVARWRYDCGDNDGEQIHIRGVDIFEVKNGFISNMLSYVKCE